MIQAEKLTNRQSLIILHAVEAYRRLPLAKDGKAYGPGFFYKRNWEGTLNDDNRRITLRLARIGQCVRCGLRLSENSQGDHLIPLVKDGPQGATNYLPLCRSCNASKGKRDFLDWWIISERSPADLSNDVLCSYARLTFQWLDNRNQLDESASPGLAASAIALLNSLPLRHSAAVLQVSSAA